MRFILLTVILFLASLAAGQETLRCGGKIVQTGMTMEEVKKHCGSPSSTSIEVQDVRSGPRVVGTTEIHIWRYDRGSMQRTAVLEFDQNELRSITYEGN